MAGATTARDTSPSEKKDAEFVINALGVFRSGLMSSYVNGERDYACSFEGPFVVRDDDHILVQALADEDGERFEYNPEEPDYIREKALLAGIRALVKAGS